MIISTNLANVCKHPNFCDFQNEFCKVMRNHVALSPARKAHSISVLAPISLGGNEPCPLVLRYGFLHHLPRTLKTNHRNEDAYITFGFIEMQSCFMVEFNISIGYYESKK